MKRFWLISILLFVFACEEDKDETPPIVMITNIQAGSELSGVVDVIVDANDNDAIALVEFFIDGQLNGTSQNSEALHTFKWDTDARINGTYQIYAKATDESENVATSKLLTVNVVNYRLVKILNSAVVPTFARMNEEGDWIRVESGETAEFEVPKNSTNKFEATSPTNYCGTIIEWEDNIEVVDKDMLLMMSVKNSWFFLYTINNRYEIKYTTVNKNLTGQKTCYTTIPNNGVEYKLGFYRKHSDSNIYWYYNNHPTWEYRYVNGTTNKVRYEIADSNAPDINYYARYTLPPISEVSDRIATDSYGNGYLGIPDAESKAPPQRLIEIKD